MKSLFDFQKDYLEWRRSLNMSPETIGINRFCTSIFIKWLKEHEGVAASDQIQKKHLYAFQAHLSSMTSQNGHPLRPSTINLYIGGIKNWLIYLSTLGHLRKDLPEALRRVKIPVKLPGNVLSHAQVRKLLSGISTDDLLGYRDRALLELLYSSGVRAGELLRLDIDHINFKDRSMLVTGKGNKQRMVPIGKTALRHLETYVKAVRPFLLKNQKERKLFLNTKGTGLKYRRFLDCVHAHAKRAGFEHITPHTFRRSCTTELIRNGANMYHVKEFLGHESIETLKSYTKLTLNDLKKTHEKCHPRERDYDRI